VINEKEAKVVRRIFKMSLEMQSCRKITEALNAEGILTKTYRTKTGKNFGGQRFTEKVVYSILTDHKYVGRLQHKGVLYPAEHKAIVSDELFDKVQAVLKSNHQVAHKHQSKRFALLRGMLRCVECGSHKGESSFTSCPLSAFASAFILVSRPAKSSNPSTPGEGF
jgi:site-specific DNA recombinase